VTQQGTATGVGAALGAIVGGVAGNQVGGGSGQKIATVAGGQQFITVPDATGIAVGSSVEVQGSNIYLR